MTEQQKELIDNALHQRCKELKEGVISRIDYTLGQLQKYIYILLYDLIDNGGLELPDKECEAFIRKFILDNEKMGLYMIMGQGIEECLKIK